MDNVKCCLVDKEGEAPNNFYIDIHENLKN
jgi:hypothetical protein